MKKNIDLINLSVLTLDHLASYLESLRQQDLNNGECLDTDEMEDLARALRDLACGSSSGLMLEADTQEPEGRPDDRAYEGRDEGFSRVTGAGGQAEASPDAGTGDDYRDRQTEDSHDGGSDDACDLAADESAWPETSSADGAGDGMDSSDAGKSARTDSDDSAQSDGSAKGESVIRCGTLEIRARSRQVFRDGKEISLTPKEFDILYFLADNRGEVFTKEQIYQAVWEDQYLMDDSNIMAFIRKIRRKIEPHPDSPEYILTIWGIGYKFNDRL